MLSGCSGYTMCDIRLFATGETARAFRSSLKEIINTVLEFYASLDFFAAYG